MDLWFSVAIYGLGSRVSDLWFKVYGKGFKPRLEHVLGHHRLRTILQHGVLPLESGDSHTVLRPLQAT